jgi:hypothetical protein
LTYKLNEEPDWVGYAVYQSLDNDRHLIGTKYFVRLVCGIKYGSKPSNLPNNGSIAVSEVFQEFEEASALADQLDEVDKVIHD